MDELAQRLYDRAAEAADEDGRLGLPAFVDWDVWPFEGDVRVRRLLPPVVPEPPRGGEGERPCGICSETAEPVWRNPRWQLVATDEPSGLPVVVWLVPTEHVDLADLDPAHAAELGVLTVAIVQILEGLPGIGRAHVLRWGDGGSHLHLLIQARPYGLPQVRGSFVTIWDDILPPLPEDEWHAWLQALGDGLTAAVGTA